MNIYKKITKLTSLNYPIIAEISLFLKIFIVFLSIFLLFFKWNLKSLKELNEISKIIPNDGNTVVKIRLRDQNNELDFKLKNKRKIDRKMLNIIRNKEISDIIR